MPTSTSRLSLPYPNSTDTLSGYPTVSSEQMVTLDNSVLYTAGVLASRPASTEAGNEYYATDTNQWFKYTGSEWVPILVGFTARGYRNAAFSLGAAGTVTKIPTDTVSFDSASGFSSGAYDCPLAGVYQVNGQISVSTTTGCTVSCGIVKNNILVSSGNQLVVTGVAAVAATVADLVSCIAGDLLYLVGSSTASSQPLSVGSSADNYLSIVKVG